VNPKIITHGIANSYGMMNAILLPFKEAKIKREVYRWIDDPVFPKVVDILLLYYRLCFFCEEKYKQK
jgi:hypothetical protein